jgi:hypothetical protein
LLALAGLCWLGVAQALPSMVAERPSSRAVINGFIDIELTVSLASQAMQYVIRGCPRHSADGCTALKIPARRLAVLRLWGAPQPLRIG